MIKQRDLFIPSLPPTPERKKERKKESPHILLPARKGKE